MKKYIVSFIAFALVAGVVVPIGTSAQTSTVQAQLDMIASLTKQIQDLQNQIKALQQKTIELRVQQASQVGELIKNLRQGSTGEDVKILQALLAVDFEVYPEGLITGLYGPLTTKAVKKFQSKHGIEQAGVVGPKTLKKLNELLKEHPLALSDDDDSDDDDSDDDDDEDNDDNSNSSRNKNKGSHPCAIVPPGHLIAKGWLKKNDKPIIPLCQQLPPGIDKKIDDDDDDGNVTSTPDTTAPIISLISSSNITTTGGTIAWTTNENSDSDVYYSTLSPLTKPSSTKVSSNSMVTSHSINLTGLTQSTVYYFIVESKDASNNESSGAQGSFITATPDISTPVISGVLVSASSTSATIIWATNESATSKVYYGTVSPLVLASSSVAEVSGLVLNHSVGLSGLTASTTYYFVLESKDASNNAVASSQSSFLTTP